ncbi:plasmid replication protein, CyRepA1 family [Burkholderia cenocepacia]|uniref:plasmid replication protein, CyRepA1 family n=1 Tax=Burkholderia cenocepacia TaxID=95486 RepID=UPI00158AB2CA|nr:plasmid replication protein, CyRepA1 family [Burkholderia cenocepacia]
MTRNISNAADPRSCDPATAIDVAGDHEHLSMILPASEIAISDIPAMKVAINRHVKNKILPGDSLGWSYATYKFENLDLAPDAFIEMVRSGFAFCAWLKGARKSKNFLCMQVLAVDVDSGLAIEDVLANPFFQKFGWFIYTTPSHRPDAPRFRIVFLMEQPIETEQRMKLAYTGIIRMFAGDRSCADASRLFFGAENCEVHRVDRVLPTEQVEYVIELGETEIHNDGHAILAGGLANSRSSVVLDSDEMVTTESDGRYLLRELKSGTRIFCPRHLDKHASAFVVTSKIGQNGVYCSACAQTLWPKWNHRSHLHVYDFYAFEDGLIEIDYEEQRQHPSEWLDNEAPVEYRDMVDEKSVFVRDARYLGKSGLPDFAEGVNCIRSPKGTGKTELLEHAVKKWKAEGKSVLLIVHRQVLAESLANRLKMHNYLRKLEVYEDRDEVLRHCVVCLDSLARYLNPVRHKYDVVLIDESEQVYSHVLSSTLDGRKRKYCFDLLHLYIRRARQVVLCDADLGWLTFNITASLRDDKGPVRFYVNRFRKNQDPMQPRHVVHLYDKESELLDYAIAVVGAGGKQFIASNSKERAKAIKKVLQDRYGDRVRVKIVTSDNSTTDEGRRFIATIKETSATYDVLIVSPSVGTGVDINIDADRPQFTHVFGFFGAAVTTHFEMDQQLARVRNMREQHVWISPARLYLEYEVDAIRQSILSRGELPEVLKGFDWEGRPQYHEDDKLIEVYAQVKSMRHASLNNIREHFIELKRREGWEIRKVDYEMNEEPKKLQKEYYGAKRAIVEEELLAIANAERIDRKRYLDLCDKQTATTAEKAQMSRYQIEQFYGVKEVTVELARLDDGGRYRECVRFGSVFLSNKYQRNQFALLERGVSVTERDDYVRKCKLLKKLLRAAGVVDEDGQLDTLAEFESRTLGAFIDAVELHVQEIGLVLNVRVRDDLREKPMLQLKAFLKLIGIETAKRRKGYEGPKKIYKYSLDLDSVDMMNKYRKNYMKGMTEIRVQQNVLDGGAMMVVTETPEKPKRMRFVNVDKKPAKRWEELTPRQRRRELLATLRKPKHQPIEPNPFDIDEGIIPLKPIGD